MASISLSGCHNRIARRQREGNTKIHQAQLGFCNRSGDVTRDVQAFCVFCRTLLIFADVQNSVQRFNGLNWPAVLREDIAWLQLATDHQGMCLPKAQLHRVFSNMRTGSKHVENVLKTWHSTLDSSYVLFHILLSYQFIYHFIYHFLIFLYVSSYFLYCLAFRTIFELLYSFLPIVNTCEHRKTQVLPLYGLHSTWFLANAFATWFTRVSQSEFSR